MDPPLNARDVHKATLRAISDGELVRPAACENCHKRVRIVAHHDDYKKPLDVRWLCDKCHVGWHRNNTAKNRMSPWTIPESDKPRKPDRHCPVCGWPVDQAGTRAPRRYHPACKKVRNHIDLAVAAAEAISPDQITARGIRRLFFQAGNRFRPEQLRDERGRFVCDNSDRDT